MSVFVLVIAPTTLANIITVDDDGPADYNNIQAAINVAVNGDTVIVAEGTYTGNGNRDIDFGGKTITVRGADPNDEDIVDGTVIDCEATLLSKHRGFCFNGGEDQNSVLAGVTVTNGCQEKGAGILCENGSSPTILLCNITDNWATLDGSWGTGQGGGIHCSDVSNAKILNCRITLNQSNCTGAGIDCENSSVTFISGCRIEENTCNGDGGGICCDNYSSATISDCLILNNMAFFDGGGIRCEDYSNLIIQNCLLTGNETSYSHGSGSAISCGSSNPTVINCTITSNSDQQATIDCYNEDPGEYSEMSVINTIIWNNSVASGYQILLGDGQEDHSSFQMMYCDFQGGQASIIKDPNIILIWGPGNIDVEPLFADDSNDYHLKSEAGRWEPISESWVIDANTSPCIDAGNPGSPLGEEQENINNVRVNMGAYGGTAEASIPPQDWALLGDLTNDGTVDFDDLARQLEDWLNSSSEQPGDLNRDGIVDMADFALLGLDWLKQTTWH